MLSFLCVYYHNHSKLQALKLEAQNKSSQANEEVDLLMEKKLK